MSRMSKARNVYNCAILIMCALFCRTGTALRRAASRFFACAETAMTLRELGAFINLLF